MPPPESPLEDATKLDITHESLIRNWDKLCGSAERKGWVQDEAEAREEYRELMKRALRKRTEDDLLRGGDLDDALQWRKRGLTAAWAERYDADPASFARVVSYVDESDARRQREREQARVAAERVKIEKGRRRKKRIAAGLLIVVGILASLVVWAIESSRNARQRALAEISQLRAMAAAQQELHTREALDGPARPWRPKKT